mgnify:CR=1 FL=1
MTKVGCMLMREREKIKVLVVDDSMLFREVITRGISTDPDIEVVATAKDPFEARDMIIAHHPHIMICDVQMPRMNGIEFLRRLLPQYPIPVIVVSALSSSVFDAMGAGAVDFITKPDDQLMHVENFIEELIHKIKVASKAKLVQHARSSSEVPRQMQHQMSKKLIAMAASTGGTEAIFTVLQCLPQEMPGMVIVQHIPTKFSKMFAERLNQALPFEVKEAETGDIVGQGRVLIAPGDQHMRVRKIGDRFKVECFHGDKVSGHRPSADVLFESVAREAGNMAVGIILTGMGYDGAKGLLAMKRRGARTIGQDETTSVVYGMPKVAYEIGAVEKQLPLTRIPHALGSML